MTLQRLHDRGDRAWCLASGDIRPGSASVPALEHAGGRYTLETISPSGEHCYERIESLRTVVPHTDELSGLIAIGAQVGTPLISFTVTEAGYYLDAAGRLDGSLPELIEDVRRGTRGRPGTTIYGAIAAILRARRAVGGGPVTLLSCDNLRHNGTRFRDALLQFCRLLDDQPLEQWIRAMTTCPNSMVDRITPRPDAAVRERVRLATGLEDPAAIVSENYHQWVIEERFAAGRPAWESVGVQMVRSVAPYEEAKIRILNGSHCALAWAGTLAGHRYIHDAVRDLRLRGIAHDYVTGEVIPCLRATHDPYPLDLAAYRDTVLERFANDGIADATQRVAMDGFAKFPGFITPTLRERLAAGGDIECSALLPAAFLKFLERWHQGALPHVYEDHAMDPVVAAHICASPDPVAAFCGSETLFGLLADHPALVPAVRRAWVRLGALLS